MAAGLAARLAAARGAGGGGGPAATAHASLLGWLYRGAVAGGTVLGAAAEVASILRGADVDVLLALLRVAGHALRVKDPGGVRDLLVYVKRRGAEVGAALPAPAAGAGAGGGAAVNDDDGGRSGDGDSDTDSDDDGSVRGGDGVGASEAAAADRGRLAIMLSLVYDVVHNRGSRGRESGGGSGGGSAADEDARQWQWVSAGVAGAPPAPIDVGWAELTDPHVTVRRWWDAAATTRRRVDAVLRAPADFGIPEPRGTLGPGLPIGSTILIECQSTKLAAGRLRLNIQTLAKLSSV